METTISGLGFRGLDNYQYYGAIFLIYLLYMVPQIDLNMILLIIWAPAVHGINPSSNGYQNRGFWQEAWLPMRGVHGSHLTPKLYNEI